MKVGNPSNGGGKVVYGEIKFHQIYAISCMESLFFSGFPVVSACMHLMFLCYIIHFSTSFQI